MNMEQHTAQILWWAVVAFSVVFAVYGVWTLNAETVCSSRKKTGSTCTRNATLISVACLVAVGIAAYMYMRDPAAAAVDDGMAPAATVDNTSDVADDTSFEVADEIKK